MNVINDSISTIKYLLTKENIKTYGENFVRNHSLYILFCIASTEGSGNTYSTDISKILESDFLDDSKDIKSRKILLEIITIFTIESIKKNDFSFAYQMVEERSKYHYEEKDDFSNKYFLLINFYFYYLYNYDDTIPTEIKNKIDLLIKNKKISTSLFSYSYKDILLKSILYTKMSISEFLNHLNGVQEFIKTPRLHLVRNEFAKEYEIAIFWYIALLLASGREDVKNLITIKDCDFEYDSFDAFDEILKMYYKQKNKSKNKNEIEIDPKEKLFKNVNEYYYFYDNFEENVFSDYNFEPLLEPLNSLLINLMIDGSKNIDKSLIETENKIKLEELIKSEIGYDKEILISKKCVNFNVKSIAACKYLLLYNSELGQIITDSLMKEISNNLLSYFKKEGYIKYIYTNNKDFNNELKEIINTNDKKIYFNNLNPIKSNIKDEELKASFKNKLNNFKLIDDPLKLFENPTIILEDDFSFNFKIKVSLEDLPINEVYERIDKHKTDDGYMYSNCLFKDKEQFIEFGNKLNARTNVQCFFEIKSKKGGIIQIIGNNK